MTKTREAVLWEIETQLLRTKAHLQMLGFRELTGRHMDALINAVVEAQSVARAVEEAQNEGK